MKVLISCCFFLAIRCKKIFSQRKKWRGPGAGRCCSQCIFSNRRVCVYVCVKGGGREDWRGGRKRESKTGCQNLELWESLPVCVLWGEAAAQWRFPVGREFKESVCLGYRKVHFAWMKRSSGWLVKVMHNGEDWLSVLCLDTFERNHMSGEWNEW